MTKYELVRLVIKFGSKDLGLNKVDVVFFSGIVLNYDEICGFANIRENTIYIQDEWMHSVEINEVIIVVLHELRHLYQIKEVRKLGRKSEKQKLWKDAFNRYLVPNEENLKAYLQNEIEIDAIDYSHETCHKLIMNPNLLEIEQ